jgi:hypothetical protein
MFAEQSKLFVQAYFVHIRGVTFSLVIV